ncbi:hypothetical protein [Embleya sp. NPDC059259]|uniref:hypothetical protein n=1 Tax=unclassified Embleya TaxID=2699296 RepID=UPI0036903E72
MLTSTWGPQSLLRRRPGLPAELAAELPYDTYQLALIVHPNERSRIGTFDLEEQLAPALDAGMILAAPHEEWAALLVAADAVITDHGSTALYAAALDRPIIRAHDGGDELIPGSPMAELLAHSPQLADPGGIGALLAAHRPGTVRAFAAAAFAEQGHALERLRGELYRLLDLTPPSGPATARVLPVPAAPLRTPAAFAVRARLGDHEVHVERRPTHGTMPAQHIAAEYGPAGIRHLQSAALVYRRHTRPAQAAGHHLDWTPADWTARILADLPGCRTAAVILSPSHCVVRTRAGALLTAHLEPHREHGRVHHPDPAAVLGATHAWLARHPDLPATIACLIGDHTFRVHLTPTEPSEPQAPFGNLPDGP